MTILTQTEIRQIRLGHADKVKFDRATKQGMRRSLAISAEMARREMSPIAFASWRSGLGLSKMAAANALGLCRNSIQWYEDGSRKIPRYVALACAAVAKGLQPIE